MRQQFRGRHKAWSAGLAQRGRQDAWPDDRDAAEAALPVRAV